MREIKFRAWDIERKIMFEVHEYMPSQPPAFVGAVSDSNLNQMPLSIVHLMQFTGLKDKNGVEIYEGDIVKNHYMNQGKICSITFEEGSFMVDYKHYIDPIQDHFCNENDFCAWLEIIGNVYSNPEILKP